MKKVLLLLVVSLYSLKSLAQWNKKVGLNLLPMTVRSFELASEFSKNNQLAFTANVLYLHHTSYEGLSGVKVYDGVIDRETSGVSLKLGGRFYVFKTFRDNKRGRQPAVNIFVGASLIGSWYHKKADYFDLIANMDPPMVYNANKRGFLWGPAIISGLTFRLSSRLHLDTGIQYAFMMNQKGKDIGYGSFNYEPGFGSSKSAIMMLVAPPFAILATHSQAIVTLKYRL